MESEIVSCEKKMESEIEPTRIMIAVNESSIKGYPHPSISSKRAFEWTLQKIVRSNTSAFKLLFLHVQVPDEDGSFSLYFLSFRVSQLCFLFIDFLFSGFIAKLIEKCLRNAYETAYFVIGIIRAVHQLSD